MVPQTNASFFGTLPNLQDSAKPKPSRLEDKVNFSCVLLVFFRHVRLLTSTFFRQSLFGGVEFASSGVGFSSWLGRLQRLRMGLRFGNQNCRLAGSHESSLEPGDFSRRGNRMFRRGRIFAFLVHIRTKPRKRNRTLGKSEICRQTPSTQIGREDRDFASSPLPLASKWICWQSSVVLSLKTVSRRTPALMQITNKYTLSLHIGTSIFFFKFVVILPNSSYSHSNTRVHRDLFRGEKWKSKCARL